MPAGEYFSQSQREAWGYVEYGIHEGYGQIEALQEYRAGGGKIRTQLWSDIWNERKAGERDWDSFSMYRKQDTVPAFMYVQTPINYRDTYTVRAKATLEDSQGNVIGETYRQLSFSTRRTKQEIEDLMKEEFRFGVTSMTGNVKEFTEWEFYVKPKG